MTSVSDKAGEAVLVIGGRGFVGAAVTRHLIARGRRPHLFGPPMQDDLLVDCIGRFDETQGSVEDRDALARIIERSGASDLITTAAYSSGRAGLMRSGDADNDRALTVNVLGFRNTLEAARATGIRRLVWTSSTVVYGDADGYDVARVDEDAPRRPLTFYGLTKQLAEDIAAFQRNRYGLDVIGLRLPLVLGPGLWYQGAASAIAALIESAGSGDAHRAAFHAMPMDLMHVDDVAAALAAALAADGAVDAIYNINGFTARLSDVVADLKRRFPTADITIDAQPPALRFPLIDDSRFRERFAFSPAYGLADIVESMLPRELAHV